ncbi:DUF5692 family protein [Romboutsia sp.]|uniref:DUF5692 family protein n=1 Tax=Romboutsia sp. TaxID=1965302 RepID=UPI003F2F243F
MGLFYEGYTISGIFTLILFMGVLIAINEVTRRSKILSIVVYCGLPLFLGILIFTNILGSPTGKTWFGWIKVVSALIGVCGFMMIRFTKLGKTKFAAIFPVVILSINIAEAVYRELEVFGIHKIMEVDPSGVVILGGTWNILNAIAGILCIVTLTGFTGITVSKDKSKDMIWPDMTWMYIIGYTLWNFAYVYNCISTRSMYAGFGILVAALIAEFLFKRGAWLQHRAQILSLYAMFSLSFDFQANNNFQIVPVYQESMWLTISIISFLFNLGVFVYMIYSIKKHKKNPLKSEIYTHTKYFKYTVKVNNL